MIYFAFLLTETKFYDNKTTIRDKDLNNTIVVDSNLKADKKVMIGVNMKKQYIDRVQDNTTHLVQDGSFAFAFNWDVNIFDSTLANYYLYYYENNTYSNSNLWY